MTTVTLHDIEAIAENLGLHLSAEDVASYHGLVKSHLEGFCDPGCPSRPTAAGPVSTNARSATGA